MAGKGRSFSAKLAHEISTHGKVICPKCNAEIKKVKLIRNRKADTQSWGPKYEFASVCKCNETDVLAGKI